MGIKGTKQVICPRCGRKGTRRHEKRKCGKPNCTKCPHGPYYLVYHRHGTRVLHCWIGKIWPSEPSEEAINYVIETGVAKSKEEAIEQYKKMTEAVNRHLKGVEEGVVVF